MTGPAPKVIRQDILNNGVLTGLLGFATVALVTAVLNIDLGRSPFYTAALFGSALFYHLTDPAALVVAAGPVFAYTALHLLVYVGLGVLISWLVTLAERYPAALYLILFPLLFVAAHLFLALIIFAEPLLGAAGPLQIGLASVVAAVAMGVFVWHTHPLLRHDLADTPLGAVPGDD